MPGSFPSEHENRELELTAEEFRALVEKALEKIEPFLRGLPDMPTHGTEGIDSITASLKEPTPSSGTSFDILLATLFEQVFQIGFNTASPGYLGYIPGGGVLHSALADLIAGVVNRYTTVYAAGPGLAQIEATVIGWFAEWVGYPDSARGFLTTGGSLANFSAIVTARCDKLPEQFLDGTIYVSEQVHHSIVKSARLAGFPLRNIRSVPTDARFRIRLDLLEESIAADRARGARPFLVVGSAGTTNTGAIDDLEALADISGREDLWLHVDAAYGGFFVLTSRGRGRLRGLDRADSITLDPHKALFLPYGTGSLLVRNGMALRRAHSASADYLPPMQVDDARVDLCEISPELSRGFRGLRVWLPLKLHGIEPFRDNLDEKLDLTAWITERIRELPGIEIVAEPQLSVVAFRHRPEGMPDGKDLDAHNATVLERVNAGGRVFLTGTRLSGGFVIRFCVLSFRTHRDRMEEAVSALREATTKSG
ncbi:MAG: aminotransferase class I/II-fold pyridoxal phosphate-dependent enzyme [Planctomycetota bacterium]